MRVTADRGTEMRPTDSASSVARLVGRFLEGGHFTCTLRGGNRYDNEWEPLAVNKFDEVVALTRCNSDGGYVIIVPQIRDKTAFLVELLTSALPEIAPHLFPGIEQGRWIHWPEYELTRVGRLKSQQVEIDSRAKAQIAAIDEEIALERESNGWLHTLITGTDVELVDAVKLALSVLGFSKIVDVDIEQDRDGKSRREDLQVQDGTPTLVVDIKGIGGLPADADALQADKHAAMRMREQKRTDIVGLSIINHQRHLPPLERDNGMPFRQELVDAAIERTLGLLTAWDLYRLVRNARKLNWAQGDVRSVFYKAGRIEAVPEHYEFLGTVAKAWTDKFGVIIDGADVQVGDSLAIEFPVEFEEMRVESIHINDQAAESASKGDPAGFRWTEGKPRIREGMRVFRVRLTT